MDISRRRCYSEHFSPSSLDDLVAPHRAVKRRQEQLLQQSRASAEISSDTTSHEKPSGTNPSRFRIPLTPTDLTRATNAPWPNSSKRGTKRKPLPNSGQVDSADQFPTIETVLTKGGSTRDRGKEMAESRFYEQVGTDGILRRTSMIKSVSKDDCLISRGANPRTGLITPEALSIAGSLDTERKQFASKHQAVPAQWTLDGDQWVSISPHTDRSTSGPPDSSASKAAWTGSASLARNISPLTSENLAHFKKASAQSSQNNLLSNTPKLDDHPLVVGKIRRKPVASKPRVAVDCEKRVHSHKSNQRVCENMQRVLTTKDTSGQDDPTEPQTEPPCPVERPHHAAKFPSRSFLESAAESKPSGTLPTRGFAARKMDRDLLELSLRTNNGPYPLPASNVITVPTHKYEHLLEPKIEVIPTAKSRCSTREADIEVSHRQIRSIRHPYLRHEQQMFGTESPQSGIMCTATNTLTSRGQNIVRTDHSRKDALRGTQTQRTLFSQGIGPNPCKAQATAIDIQDQVPCQHGSLSQSTTRPLIRRGKAASASQCPVHEITTTTTGSNPPSNKTGTNSDLEDNEEAVHDEVTDSILPYPAGRGTPLSTYIGPWPIQLNENAGTIQDKLDQSLLLDHSNCCPECCVFLDCHESCSGHPSPNADRDSETTSLRSMGVFDTSFATSVAAVNKVLLTPRAEEKNKFARLSTALLRGKKSIAIPTRTAEKNIPLKRTLRPSPAYTKKQLSPTKTATPDPVKAARSAVAVEKNKICSSSSLKLAERDCAPQTSFPILETNSKTHVPVSNEGRRVSLKLAETPDPAQNLDHLQTPMSNSSATFSAPVARSSSRHRASGNEGDCISVISAVASIARYAPIRLTGLNDAFMLFASSQKLFITLRDMVSVILNTLAVLSSIMLTYKKRGVVTLPTDKSATGVVGDILQSLLYMVIIFCVYALAIKVCRALLAILRILLMPVRLCVWIVG